MAKSRKSVVMSELIEMSVVMATGMGPNNQGCNYKRVLSGSYWNVKYKHKYYTKSHNHNYGSLYQRSYLHRFKLTDTPKCACGYSDQTLDHILYEYALINKERDSLISRVGKTHTGPIDKRQLITKYYQPFIKFSDKISFDKLASGTKISKQT